MAGGVYFSRQEPVRLHQAIRHQLADLLAPGVAWARSLTHCPLVAHWRRDGRPAAAAHHLPPTGGELGSPAGQLAASTSGNGRQQLVAALEVK
jgi:hypothetical protein